MKKLNLSKTLFIFLILFYAHHASAQTTREETVPKVLTNAFAVKYPNGKFKKWTIDHGNYAGTFNLDGQTYEVVYDKLGNWIYTSSKIKWTWKLPKEVKDGFKKSKYGTWDVNGIKKMESPNGQFYQLSVDNSGLQRDTAHSSVFTKSILVDFKPDGTISKEKDITPKSLF